MVWDGSAEAVSWSLVPSPSLCFGMGRPALCFKGFGTDVVWDQQFFIISPAVSVGGWWRVWEGWHMLRSCRRDPHPHLNNQCISQTEQSLAWLIQTAQLALKAQQGTEMSFHFLQRTSREDTSVLSRNNLLMPKIMKNLNILNRLSLKEELADGFVMCPDLGYWTVPAPQGQAGTGCSYMAPHCPGIHQPLLSHQGEKPTEHLNRNNSIIAAIFN